MAPESHNVILGDHEIVNAKTERRDLESKPSVGMLLHLIIALLTTTEGEIVRLCSTVKSVSAKSRIRWW